MKSQSAAIQDTSAERTARVQKLRTLTQAEYNQLLHIVKAIVPTKFCDPADALSHGLLIALQKFDGRGPLSAYVPRCAFLYALQQVKKRRWEMAFCDLQTDSDFDDYLDRILPYLEDPRYIEAVDELFVRRIEEILAGMYDYHFRHSTHEALGNATRMLSLFRDNANLGKGVGIDEYEQTPLAKSRMRGRRLHNGKLVRRLILDHLREELHLDQKDTDCALQALRISTRQALHEGWLPC